MKLRIVLGGVAIGVIGLVLSTILMENPYGEDQLFYGYPFLWVETSKTLRIQFPPIPQRLVILTGFFVDFPIYLILGFVISYLVFTLKENKNLLKFFIKSGIILFVGAFLLFGLLASAGGPTIYGPPPFFVAGQVAFLFSLAATPAATIIYGYYRLFRKWKMRKVSSQILNQ